MKTSVRPGRKTKRKLTVEKCAGFAIRRDRNGYIVQVRRNDFQETTYHATLEGARLHCEQLARKKVSEGISAFTLTPTEREEARRALDLLGGRTGLVEAARTWLRLHPDQGAMTVSEVFRQHIADIEARNRRPDTLRERTQRLKRFEVDYGSQAAATITPGMIEEWLSLRVPPKSFNPFRLSLSAAFSFAARKGIVMENPVARVGPKSVERSEPHFWPVSVVASVLKAAHAIDAKRTAQRGGGKNVSSTRHTPLVPSLVLTAFAGLRPAEAARLDWSNINFDESLIRVPAAASKTRRARLVPMPANLVAWLTPYRRSAGPVAPSDVTLKRGRKAILQAAGVGTTWPQDVLRHSFATYHMAVHAHEGRCAEIMGNSPAVIQRHYKGLASEKAGKEYFALEPPAPATLTVLPATA